MFWLVTLFFSPRLHRKPIEADIALYNFCCIFPSVNFHRMLGTQFCLRSALLFSCRKSEPFLKSIAFHLRRYSKRKWNKRKNQCYCLLFLWWERRNYVRANNSRDGRKENVNRHTRNAQTMGCDGTSLSSNCRVNSLQAFASLLDDVSIVARIVVSP